MGECFQRLFPISWLVVEIQLASMLCPVVLGKELYLLKQLYFLMDRPQDVQFPGTQVALPS